MANIVPHSAVRQYQCWLVGHAQGVANSDLCHVQVPQFLYEGGYRPGSSAEHRSGRIGVTQPRRVAAAAAAQRVAYELQSAVGDTVGFQAGPQLCLETG